MEKRALLAVLLSFFVLYFYYSIMGPVPPPKGQEPIVEGTVSESSTSTPASVHTDSPTFIAGKEDAPDQLQGDEGEVLLRYTPTEKSIPERTIVIESDLFKATLSNRGANLRSMVLKNYRDRVGEEATDYEMVWPAQSHGYYPITMIFQSSDLQNSFREGVFTLDSEENYVHLTEVQPSTTLHFERIDERGIKLSKTVTFHADSYLIDVAVDVTNLGMKELNLTWTIVGGEGIGPEGTEKSTYVHFGPVFAIDEEGKLNLEKLKPKDLESGERVFKDGVRWAAFGSPYFCSAIIPAEQVTMYAIAFNGDKDIPVVGLRTPLMQGGENTAFSTNLEFFIGPKDRAQLEKAPNHLINIIDYGMFGIIALPLFNVLKFFHGYVASWGLAIILLTVVIKIIFYPLTRSSYQSMEKMKLIQPQMQDLRVKYKDDANKMNKEIWDLYKKHKVNPMGGCFPMLLQIPVFLALYNVLYVSIELRHSPFLYIPDLSAYDPYYISPILMGASMLLQQHLTPTMGDPKQAQIMKLMPVIFTVMFIYFPSGLVIYWLVNNVITIGQQILIKRKAEATALMVEPETQKKGKKKKERG